MNANLFARLCRRFPADPARVFIERPDGSQLSYGDAVAASGRMAAALAGLGVRPGDRVAAQVAKSPEALLLYLGALRAGAVYLPLNPGYTAAEIEYLLGDAEPRLVVCAPEHRSAIEASAAASGVARIETLAAGGGGSLLAAGAEGAPGFADAVRAAGDLAAIVYTSGTTGRAKGAMLTHGNLYANAETLAAAWRFTGDDVLLHALPIFHVHGLFVATHVVLLAGASMLFLPEFDVDEILRLLPRATTLMGVPTFYTRLLAHPRLSRELVRHMRLFVAGSAPLSAATFRQFEERTGHAILERYGMTETGMNASNPYAGERRPGTVGFPLPGVEIRIADRETGRPVAAGEAGMIEVRGANVFSGYWRRPEQTAREFRADGFFVTGDLGRFDADGYLHIVGRDKDLIITGGYNVYPAEVEAALEAVGGVGESAVIGVPHPDFGEGVTAVVAPRPGAELSEAAIHAALAEKLAKYKLPKRVVIVDRLPRNSMGKVQKNLLRSEYADLYR
jgi:malonyl-CoA/methylmalonyl-CoA synthetase